MKTLFGKLKRRKTIMRNNQLNYVRREGPKLNKAPFKHNESQNAIIYDVSRPCEKETIVNLTSQQIRTIIKVLSQLIHA